MKENTLIESRYQFSKGMAKGTFDSTDLAVQRWEEERVTPYFLFTKSINRVIYQSGVIKFIESFCKKITA